MGGAPPLPHDFAPQGSKNGPFLAGFRPEDQGPGGGLRTPRKPRLEGGLGPPPQARAGPAHTGAGLGRPGREPGCERRVAGGGGHPKAPTHPLVMTRIGSEGIHHVMEGTPVRDWGRHYTPTSVIDGEHEAMSEAIMTST